MQRPSGQQNASGMQPKTQPKTADNRGPTIQQQGDVTEKPQSPQPPPQKNKRNKLLIAALVAVIAAFGLYHFTSSPNLERPVLEEQMPEYQRHINPIAASAVMGSADIDQNASQQAKEAAQQGKPIPGLPDASPELREAAGAGKVSFYSVRFYDTVHEDGDYIRVTIDGAGSIGPFMITHPGTIIRVPVIEGQPVPEIRVDAIKDGSGGITLGAQTSTGVWYSKVLPEGAFQIVPLVIK